MKKALSVFIALVIIALSVKMLGQTNSSRNVALALQKGDRFDSLLQKANDLSFEFDL